MIFNVAGLLLGTIKPATLFDISVEHRHSQNSLHRRHDAVYVQRGPERQRTLPSCGNEGVLVLL
jgi:hypothetical protein